MKYKAVCFDLDGTLYPPEILRKFLALVAVRHPLVSRRYMALRKEMRRLQTCDEDTLSGMTFTEKETLIYARYIRKGLDEDRARKELDRHYYAFMRQFYRGLTKQVDVRSTFEKLKAKGLRIGVFSDWPRYDKLERIDVADLCDFVSDSLSGGFLKPDPRAFDELLGSLGVKPQEVLYIGDSYEKDVLGSSAAGFDCVLVNSQKTALECPKALAVFPDWKSFDSWIDTIMEN